MTLTASCKNCGGSVDPSRKEACPHCGQYAGKTIRATINDPIGIRDAVARTREFFEYHRGWAILLVLIVLISPFVGLVIAGGWGLVVGLLLSILSIPVGVLAVTKVRETTRKTH
jgi:hypothetical protein